MPQDEEGVVLSIAEGSSNVGMSELNDFDPLVRRHQRRIYRVLLGMLGDADTAETLTQDYFLKAYRNRASFRGEASAGVWLLKIAVNLARDHRRSRVRAYWKRVLSGSEGATDVEQKVPDPHTSPEQTLLAQEELSRVWSAVRMLSPRQRAVFILRFVEEMSLEEIAESTCLNVGTVKAHLFRAVSAIRQRFKEGETNEPSSER